MDKNVFHSLKILRVISLVFSFLIMPLPNYAQMVTATMVPETKLKDQELTLNRNQYFQLTGIRVFDNKPFNFDFIIEEKGSTAASLTNESKIKMDKTQDKTKEIKKIIKYFLTGLTIPEGDLWVNLSPYERNRIIPFALGDTLMGREMLVQDVVLKQMTSQMMHPDHPVGKSLWKKIYQRAQETGMSNIPVNTLNKVWIVPNEVEIYESKSRSSAYITRSTLKVMLEEDYLALHRNILNSKSQGFRQGQNKSEFLEGSSLKSDKAIKQNMNKMIQEIILPVLEDEINNSEAFTSLRQIYHSLILATWYKETIKESLIAKHYVNQGKVGGLGKLSRERSWHSSKDKVGNDRDQHVSLNQDVEAIYQKYMKSFKKGAYNFIREEPDPITSRVIIRKYFSGGITWKLELKRRPECPNKELNATLIHVEMLDRRDSALNRNVFKPGNNQAMLVNKDRKLENEVHLPLLKEPDIKETKLMGGGYIRSFYIIPELKQDLSWQIANGWALYDPGNWLYQDSSLNQIDLKIKIKDRIIALSKEAKQKGAKINILDWGCGNGQALSDLRKWLESNDIDNVNLYGFANKYYPNWRLLSGIKLFWGSQEELFDLIKSENGLKVDLMFSFWGLEHLKISRYGNDKRLLLDYFDQIMSEGGIIVTNMIADQLLQHDMIQAQPILGGSGWNIQRADNNQHEQSVSQARSNPAMSSEVLIILENIDRIDITHGQMHLNNGRIIFAFGQGQRKIIFKIDHYKVAVEKYYKTVSLNPNKKILLENQMVPKFLGALGILGKRVEVSEWIDGPNLDEDNSISPERQAYMRDLIDKMIERGFIMSDFKGSNFIIGKNQDKLEKAWIIDDELILHQLKNEQELIMDILDRMDKYNWKQEGLQGFVRQYLKQKLEILSKSAIKGVKNGGIDFNPLKNRLRSQALKFNQIYIQTDHLSYVDSLTLKLNGIELLKSLRDFFNES